MAFLIKTGNVDCDNRVKRLLHVNTYFSISKCHAMFESPSYLYLDQLGVSAENSNYLLASGM